jgi:plasmid stabilization system protein ParE
MDCKVSWTNKAWKTYEANINYLKESWTQKEIVSFILLVDRKILSLSKYPRIGISRNKKYPNIRSTVVHKRILLIYKHKPQKNEIDLLVFWNTYSNPHKLKP